MRIEAPLRGLRCAALLAIGPCSATLGGCDATSPSGAGSAGALAAAPLDASALTPVDAGIPGPTGIEVATLRVPIGDVSIGEISSAPISDAGGTVQWQIIPGARRCYQRALERDPSQAGSMAIVVQINPSGAVDSATAPDGDGLHEDLTHCVLAVLKRAKFAAPGPLRPTIHIPLTFAKIPDAWGPPAPTAGTISHGF